MMKSKDISENEIKQVIEIYIKSLRRNDESNNKILVKDGIVDFLYINIDYITQEIAEDILKIFEENKFFISLYNHEHNRAVAVFKKMINLVNTDKVDNQVMLIKVFSSIEVIKYIQLSEQCLNAYFLHDGEKWDWYFDILRYQQLKGYQIEQVISHFENWKEAEKRCWKLVAQHQKVDMDFILQYEKELDGQLLIQHQELDMDFIIKNLNKINFQDILLYQNIDSEFYEKYKKKIFSKLKFQNAPLIVHKILHSTLNDNIKREIKERYEIIQAKTIAATPPQFLPKV